MYISIYKMRCVLGCVRNAGSSLHRFPNFIKFPEQFKAWVFIVGGKLERPEDHLKYKNKRICDIHFTSKDRNRNNRLSALAVPSLHLPMWCNKFDENSLPSQLTVQTTSSQIEKVKTTDQSAVLSPVTILGEHNYCTNLLGSIKPNSGMELINDNIDNDQSREGCPMEIVKTTGQSAVLSPVTILGEHNYCKNLLGSIKPSKKLRRKEIPREIKNLKHEILRLRKRSLNFKAKLDNAQKMSQNTAFQKITKNMTNPAKIFTMMQFRESLKNPKGRRFTMEEKILSLSFFKRSAKCYSLLSKQFVLPSKKSLKLLLSSIKLRPGINKIIFDKIKHTVASINDDKKVCSLIFDEMSITPEVHYDASQDELKGFANNDPRKFADHVLVFMIKGIKANYKQPVAYYFTNGLKKDELKQIIYDVIKNIQATGLHVLCTVCDQSTVNVSAINSLVEDTKSEYMRRGCEYRFNHFKINNELIIPLYDPPHLLKGIRNNLLNKDMIYTDNLNIKKMIKWEYFEKLYAADKPYGELRIAHRLTDEHIIREKINKMKVKTAAQVFSQSVAAAAEHLTARGDLTPECRDLIPLVLMFDKVFDSLNSSTFDIPNGKKFRGSVKRNSPHHLLWQEAIKMFKTVKFLKEKNCEGEVRFIELNVPSVTNFIKTLEGIQNVWKILYQKYSFDTLLTRNLNQDPIENFFGNIRSYGVRNVAPNTIAFEGAYKSLLLNNYNAPHSIRSNCEEDKNKCLQTIDFFLTEKPSSDIPEEKNDNFTFNLETIDSTLKEDKGQSNYVCGWVVAKCFKKITKTCKICKRDLNEKCEVEGNALIRAKEFNKRNKWLCYPNKNVIEVFQEIQRITCSFLKKDVPKYGLQKNIKMMCETLIIYPFTCTTHQADLKAYFVDITIKVLIYSWCRSINRILKGKIRYDENSDDELKLLANLYFIKHKKYNKNTK